MELMEKRQFSENYFTSNISRSIIPNDDQKDPTILAYLFIPNQLYMFRAMCSPIITRTWLYLQLLVMSTDVAAGWCHGWDGTSVSNVKRQWLPWKEP